MNSKTATTPPMRESDEPKLSFSSAKPPPAKRLSPSPPGALMTLIGFPFAPRRIARAHADSTLLRVYSIHVLGLALLGLVIAGLDGCVLAIGVSSESLIKLIATDSDAATNAALTVVWGELVFVVVATVMMCWAGADERFRDTWRFSLRVSWLYISQFCWVVAVCGLSVIVANSLGLSLFGLHLLVLVWSATIIGSMVSYLRALTVNRGHSVIHADAMCEWCGYNINHIDSEGRCPECGHSVVDSLDTTKRQPFDTNHVHLNPLGRAIFDPEPLFRSIAVRERASGAVAKLVFVLAMTSAVAGGALVTSAALLTSGFPFEVVVVFFVMFGLAAAWCYFMFMSGLATLLGSLVMRQTGRNRFVAAWHVMSLTSGVIPIWAAGASLAFGAMVAMVQGDLGHIRAVTGWILFIGLNAIVAVFYWRMLTRRMNFVQYSNR